MNLEQARGILAPKQVEIMRHYRRPERMLVAVGAAQSGKTVAACQAFALWSQAMRPGGTFILAGQSVGSVLDKVVFGDRKLLDALSAVAPNPPILKTSQGARVLVPQDDGTVSRYLIYGGDDEGDRKRLQGLSANGALLDEAALLTESFYMMLTTRLSDPRTAGMPNRGHAKMWLTLNPEGKQHWLKKRIVDKREELKARVITFTLDDNPYLPPGYKESLLASLVGHYKVRLFEGEWADASGLVFPVWHHADAVPTGITRYSVGYDYGDSTVTCALLFAHTDGVPTVLGLESKRVAISEYYYDARVKGYRSQKDHLDAIQAWLKPFTGGEYLVVFGDPSTPEGVQRMFRDKGMSFQEAENAVADGLATTASALVTGDVTIYVPGCPNLVREMSEYRWDEKAMEIGEDKPVKVADHAPDAMRYNVSSSPRIARVVTGMM